MSPKKVNNKVPIQNHGGARGSRPGISRKKIAPPSRTSELADQYPVVEAIGAFLKALAYEIATAYRSLKWHSLTGLICAIVISALDMLSFSRLGDTAGNIGLAASSWDGVFFTLLLFISIDAGIKYAVIERKRFDQVSPLIASAQYFGTAASVLFAVLLPSAVRFATAIPVEFFDRGALKFILLNLTYFYITIAALGGIASLAAAGLQDAGARRISRAVWLLIPAIVFVNFITPESLKLNNAGARFFYSFSSGGILELANPYSALFALDITFSSSLRLALTVLVSLVTCITSYLFLSLVIGALKLAAEFVPARISAARIAIAIPAPLSSALAAAIGTILLVGDAPMTGLSHPSASVAYFPLSALALTGFGLAIAVAYLHSKTERESATYIGQVSAHSAPALSLSLVQLSVFLPFFTFVAAVGALGISPVLDVFTIIAAWTILFVAGSALVMLSHMAVAPKHRGTASAVIAGAAVAVFTYGAYGSPTWAGVYFQAFNPYDMAAALLSHLTELSLLQRWLYFILVSAGMVLAVFLQGKAETEKRVYRN